MDAVAALRRRGLTLQVVLLGEGPERTTLVERAHAAGIADLVHLPGRVNDVEPYLRASDVFVLPSYQEGLSVALLEAMALGMPAVASDIPANRVLSENGSVVLTPVRDATALAEAILHLLNSSDTGQSVGQAARALVQARYSLAAIAEQHLALFSEVARSKIR
jgi:glycosyltransferase involved in cell wall biosynthesis